jgi:hypothetical protein
VEYTDTYLGTVYASTDETFTLTEITEIYGSMQPIDPGDIPGSIRKKLREIVHEALDAY